MRCIFCKQDSSTSRSVEHVMPESIGSKKRVLPRGMVCDKCNNYFARKVEEPVLSHPSMRNVRAWYQVPSKRGKYPSMVGNVAGTDIAVGLRRDHDGRLCIQPERGSDLDRFRESIQPDPDGNLSNPLLFKIDIDPPKREMSRFLCKMALEAIAELFASDSSDTAAVVDSEFFDNIRTYARYGTNYPDWPYTQRRIYPEQTLMQHPETGEWVQAGFGCCFFMNRRRETLFAFCFYGVEFVINVGGPSIRGYEEWLQEHGNISPLVERLGVRLSTEGDGASRKYYLHGSFEARNGLEFDRNYSYCP
jgi:hypothetical protein